MTTTPQPPLTDAELDEIQDRCNDAQCGPWEVFGTGKITAPIELGSNHFEFVKTDWECCHTNEEKLKRVCNGKFIASARADVPRLLAEIKRLQKFEKLDREVATYIESVICLRTHFTGNPPYVGWKGLGLALTECLDELGELRRKVKP